MRQHCILALFLFLANYFCTVSNKSSLIILLCQLYKYSCLIGNREQLKRFYYKFGIAFANNFWYNISLKYYKMCWLFLLLSSIMEILWAVTLKFSNGFTKIVPSVATLMIMIVSIYFLSLAACFLPIGVCYAVSSGVCTIMQFGLGWAQ